MVDACSVLVQLARSLTSAVVYVCSGLVGVCHGHDLIGSGLEQTRIMGGRQSVLAVLRRKAGVLHGGRVASIITSKYRQGSTDPCRPIRRF